MEKHLIPPYYNKDSEILILGSFPSIKSRESGFYYAHPQNRFWKVLSCVFNENISNDISNKKKFLKKHKIALFDVCATCEIKGSSDASIKNVKVNDLSPILHNSNIRHIYVNGKTAFKLYNQLMKDDIEINATYLPSTSSANATFDLEKLANAYQVLNNDKQV